MTPLRPRAGWAALVAMTWWLAGPVACHEDEVAGGSGAGGDVAVDAGPSQDDSGPGPRDAGSDARPTDIGPDPSDGASDGGRPPSDAQADDGGADLLPPDAGEPIPCADSLALGRRRLADALAHEALLAFERGLQRCPEDPDLRFGAALAAGIDAAELSAMILSIVGQVTNYEVGRNEFVAESMHMELMRLRAEWLRALGHAALLRPEQVDFEVEAAWLYLGLEPTLVYRGVFDGGDLHLLRASVSFVVAVFDVIVGQDLRADLLGLVQELRGGLGGLNFATIGRIFGTLLLAEGGAFFDIHPGDGAAIFAEAPGHLAAVGRELVAALRWMQAHHEQDDRAQVSRLEPLRRGADLADGAQIVVSNVARLDPETGLVEETELRSGFPVELQETFERVSASFDQPGVLVPFRTEVLPILATVLGAALHLGLLDSLLGSLPIDLRVLDHAGLTQALDLFLPLPLALDPGTFFAQPAGLRVILPQVEDAEPPRFVAEWECPGDLDETGYPSGSLRMLCAEGAELLDLPHYLGEPWELQSDGWLARTPYLVWEDATLNGLLWVDQDALDLFDPEHPGQFAPADLRSLNAALAVGLAPLLNLLSGAL